MSLNYHELTKRKASYFTTSFLTSLITRTLAEAKRQGPYTLFYMRIYLGDELCYLFEQLRKTLRFLKKYPRSRSEQACRRALFYANSDLATLKQLLIKNLGRLELTDQIDIDGQPLDLDF